MSSKVYYSDASGVQIASINQIFTNGGTPTDPSPITLTVTDPSFVTTTYTVPNAAIVKNSTGNYTANIPITSDGLWAYAWVVTGTLDQNVFPGTFTSFPDTPQNWYTSLQEMKSRFTLTDTTDDFELVAAIEATSADIEQFTGRFFYQTAAGTVRTYRNDNIYDVDIDDVVSISQFATSTAGQGVYDTVWNSTQYQLQTTFHKYNQAAKGEL